MKKSSPAHVAAPLCFALGLGACLIFAGGPTTASPVEPQEQAQPTRDPQPQAQDPKAQGSPNDQRRVGESSPAEPGSVIPPSGPGDTWGYDTDHGAAPGPRADPTADGEAEATDSARRPEIAKARLITATGHRLVKDVIRLRRDVGRFELSRQGDLIAFDKVTDRGFRGLYVGHASAASERCLSCDSWDLRKSHVLSPTWHPSGRWLVALVQGPAAKLKLDNWRLAGPERGLHSELWAFSADGRDIWQLTQAVPQGGAALDAHFSQEGDRLAWARRVDTTVGGRWGSWEVRVADFEIKRGVPRMTRPRDYKALPWPGAVILHGFTDDDKGLWMTVSPAPGSASERRGFTVGTFDLETERFTPLPAPGQWDALPSGIPRSERRVWVSDRGIERPRAPRLPWRGDLWLSSASGRRQERLTYFNDPQSDHYLGEAWIADTSWLSDGGAVLLQVLSPDDAGNVVEYLYRVNFKPFDDP